VFCSAHHHGCWAVLAQNFQKKTEIDCFFLADVTPHEIDVTHFSVLSALYHIVQYCTVRITRDRGVFAPHASIAGLADRPSFFVRTCICDHAGSK
jgi:hypothetical protein